MIRNYIKVAIRHLLRNKGITAINVAGLAIGMACCILIVLFIKDELSFNLFHKDVANIYRLNTVSHQRDGRIEYGTITQFGAAPNLKLESARLKDAVRIHYQNEMSVSTGAEKFRQENIVYGDAGLFQMFSFPLLAGNPATVLKEPYTAVLTETTARKYFGKGNPIGKTIRIQDEYDCLVTGVAKDIPANTDIGFDMVLSYTTFTRNALKAGSKPEENWFGFGSNETFVQLPAGVTPAMMRGELDAFAKKHVVSIAKQFGVDFGYVLQPLANIHLYPEGDQAPSNGYSKLYIYGVIGLFIILIACINFMNLVTARGQERAMEVGLRKVMGAARKALITQFLIESVIVSITAFLLAILLAQCLLAGFNYVTSKHIELFILTNTLLFAALFLLSIVVGLLAGSYPALYLSGFLPVRILKGGAGTASGKSLFRKVLVVSQFTIAIGLIVATIVIYSQLRYMQQQDLGYNRKGLVNLSLRSARMSDARDVMKTEVLQLPFVKSASYTSTPFGGGGGINVNPVGNEGVKLEDNFAALCISTDFSYLTNAGVKMLQGRDFDPRFPSDSIDAFVINEVAAKKFGAGITIGSRIVWNGSDEPRKGKVIGIVKDFNIQSLRQPIMPMVAMMNKRAGVLSIRLADGDTQAQLAQLEKVWNKVLPAFPFNYRFVEGAVAREYDQEQRSGGLFGAYAALAIIIACMGLFGLAMLIARQRTKEIGIRKVLGASVANITVLLSRDFLLLVFIAIFIAAPVAWYGMNQWLQNFAFHINVPWWAFAVAGLSALTIALGTISFQSIRAALLNPVRSLRSE